MRRGPVFEVARNRSGRWFVHEIAANGQIAAAAQAYASKGNAKRAAIRKAERTEGAGWRVAG